MNRDDPSARRLHDIGLKVTGPRMLVLELLQRGERRHWTVDDVYRALADTGAAVGLATLYRVQGQLEQAGILKQSRFDTERAVYELAESEHHDHLVCVACGRVVEFHDEQIEARQRELASARGFELVDHTLALYGRCKRPECAGSRR